MAGPLAAAPPERDVLLATKLHMPEPRYHHLFADPRRARLQEEQPGCLAQLHRNAAAWCEERGMANDGRAQTGAGCTLVPGPPGRFHQAFPLSGDA